MKIPYIQNATILDYFLYWEKKTPNAIFLNQAKGDLWISTTYKEAGIQARKLAHYLETLGVTKGSHVGLISKNCPEWIITDLAIMFLNAVSCPFYPNLNPSEFEIALKNSECNVLFVGKIETWNRIKSKIPKHIRVIHFLEHKDHSIIDRGRSWVYISMNYEAKEHHPEKKDEDIWTLLFTSGTSENPKGVVLTYKNIRALIESEARHSYLGYHKVLGNAHFFSILPLNHVGERILVEMGGIMVGACIYFAETAETFSQNIRSIQPTVMVAVPYLWAKYRLEVLKKIPQSKIDYHLKTPVLSIIMKNKIRKMLGVSKNVIAITETAPIPIELKKWYQKIGIHFREVYGMVESTGPVAIIPVNIKKTVTVGKPLPPTTIKVDPKTHEVLIQGPCVMKEYYKNPEKTNENIRDSWLYTGDYGSLDEKGFLYISGRIEDSFKTSTGEFIMPDSIEQHFSGNPLIDKIAVLGYARPQPFALVQLSEISKTYSKEKIEQQLHTNLESTNNILMKHEQLSHLIIIQDEWSIDNKLLTPVMKIKRDSILYKYSKYYDDWLKHTTKIIWHSPLNFYKKENS